LTYTTDKGTAASSAEAEALSMDDPIVIQDISMEEPIVVLQKKSHTSTVIQTVVKQLLQNWNEFDFPTHLLDNENDDKAFPTHLLDGLYENKTSVMNRLDGLVLEMEPDVNIQKRAALKNLQLEMEEVTNTNNKEALFQRLNGLVEMEIDTINKKQAVLKNLQWQQKSIKHKKQFVSDYEDGDDYGSWKKEGMSIGTALTFCNSSFSESFSDDTLTIKTTKVVPKEEEQYEEDDSWWNTDTDTDTDIDTDTMLDTLDGLGEDSPPSTQISSEDSTHRVPSNITFSTSSSSTTLYENLDIELTDVQILQSILLAEEAASKGIDTFTTVDNIDELNSKSLYLSLASTKLMKSKLFSGFGKLKRQLSQRNIRK